MKRIVMRILLTALCLCLLCSSVLADNLSLMPLEKINRVRTFRDVVTVGDTVWMSVYTNGELQLWRWKSGMDKAEAAAGELIPAASYSSVEDMLMSMAAEVKIPDTAHAVSVLFSDGGSLYGFNHHNGLVFTIEVEDQEAVFSDVINLQDTSVMYRMTGEYSWYNAPQSIACVDNKLLWHYAERDDKTLETSFRLRVFDLSDGSSMDVQAERVEGVCAYKDGKAIVVTRDGGEDVLTINACDVTTGELIPIMNTNEVDYLSDLVYSEQFDAVLWQDGTSIMGIRDGEVSRYAYLPVKTQGSIDVAGDTMIYAGSSSAYARTLVEGYETEHSVKVLSGVMNDAMTKFTEKFPVVPVYNEGKYSGMEETLEAYVEVFKGDDAPDVARMYVQDAPFAQLRDGGYLLDLYGYPSIASYVEQLYPVFRDYVTKDGGIYGVPVSAGSYNGFFINRKVMEKIGLTEEEIPTNLVDLCAFITRWNDEFALKYPDYAALDGVDDYRRAMYDMIMNNWMGYCEATGQELHFEDPILKEMLTALAEMRTDKIEETLKTTDPEKSDYKQGLIWTDCQLVGNFATYMEDFSDRIFLPMTLTKDTDLHVEVSTVQLYCVNSETKEAEYSVRLLEEYIAAINDKYKHVLLTTETEPVENPYTKSNMKYHNEEIADQEKRVREAKTEEERKAWQAELDALYEYVEQAIQWDFYTIHPSAIENYVKVISPAMYIRVPGAQAMNMGDVTDMMDRFLAGEESVDQFVRKLEATLMMEKMKN